MKRNSIVLTGIVLLFFVVGFQDKCDKNKRDKFNVEREGYGGGSVLVYQGKSAGENRYGRLRTFGRDENEML